MRGYLHIAMLHCVPVSSMYTLHDLSSLLVLLALRRRLLILEHGAAVGQLLRLLSLSLRSASSRLASLGRARRGGLGGGGAGSWSALLAAAAAVAGLGQCLSVLLLHSSVEMGLLCLLLSSERMVMCVLLRVVLRGRCVLVAQRLQLMVGVMSDVRRQRLVARCTGRRARAVRSVPCRAGMCRVVVVVRCGSCVALSCSGGGGVDVVRLLRWDAVWPSTASPAVASVDTAHVLCLLQLRVLLLLR